MKKGGVVKSSVGKEDAEALQQLKRAQQLT
jgi:hypothetical protein